MTDAIHEQASAFVDGELSAAESELFLKRVERDTELRSRVGRYVLAGEALRATRAQGPSRSFAANVAKAIESEATPIFLRSRVMQWAKPIAGGAIAAGVAAIALVAIQVAPNQGDLTAAGSGHSSTADSTMATSNAPQSDSVSLVANTSNTFSTSSFGQLNGASAILASDASGAYVVPTLSGNRTPAPIQFVNTGRLANYVVAHSEYSSPLGRRNVLSNLLAEEANDQSIDQNIESLNSANESPATSGSSAMRKAAEQKSVADQKALAEYRDGTQRKSH